STSRIAQKPEQSILAGPDRSLVLADEWRAGTIAGCSAERVPSALNVNLWPHGLLHRTSALYAVLWSRAGWEIQSSGTGGGRRAAKGGGWRAAESEGGRVNQDRGGRATLHFLCERPCRLKLFALFTLCRTFITPSWFNPPGIEMPDTTERRFGKRAIWIAVTLLVLVAVGLVWLRRRGASQEPRFDTVSVQRGRLIAKVTATGTLSALVTVQVGSQVSGRIAKLNVDFNSPVTKDQLIAKIDPQLFEAAVEQSRANYVAAKGNLERAKAQAIDAQRQAARSKDLLAKNLISQADYDTTETNALAAKAQVEASNGAVEQARAALHQAQINLEYTSIISPINGVVISRNVDVGQTVAASLQAPTLFTIAEDLKKMEVHTNVAEADVGKLSAGMVVTFTVDAYPNERFQGRIRQIRNAAQTIQNVVTYDAVIDVDNRDLK